MELASDTTKIAKHSPTSTPILDGVRRLPARRWLRLSAGEYFFLSGAVILTLIALPEFRRHAETLAATSGILPAAGLIYLIIPGGAFFLSLATHEAGHLFAAWLSGFRLAPNRLVLTAAKYNSSRGLPSYDVFTPGFLSLGTRKLDHLSRRLCFLVLGGPVASLAVPLLLEVYALTRATGVAFAVHVFAGISALVGIAELLPDPGKGNSSDGARLVMLLKKDPAGHRWLSIIHLQLALEQGADPRAWNEMAIASITAIDDDSRDAVAARWLAYLWATERQDVTAATKYLEEALAAPATASAWIRDQLFLEAAIFQAWFRDDLSCAHFWVARIRKRKLQPAQHLRLTVALLWAEGKLFDAWEKLADHLAQLRKLPDSPVRLLAERSAMEWKKQMESRMLSRAWRAMYSVTQEVDLSAPQSTESLSR